ncbi:MAG TPA: sigma factor-like helix-turn-helix DNA-binding protein [Actinomycetota bacterium]|nr:sigma factor-like helix-turn-helix DNA-binding protein [Actinomycetota bacterium]
MSERQGRVEAAYRADFPRLWRALYAYAGDAEIASDAAAEAFARAIRDEGTIRDVAAWTWRVAFRIAAAELRRRSTPLPDAAGPYELPQPIPELVAALRTLSPNQRLAIVLHDYADRPTSEVADAIGCSKATVHVHLSQGRRRLRALLEETDA